MLRSNWCENEMTEAYIALGANLGDRAASLAAALHGIGSIGVILRLSSVYETEPVGLADQPTFFNAVTQISTKLNARQLLNHLIEIEQGLGRARTVRNGPRVIDLDLLFYGSSVIDQPGLEVPHPRLSQRRFVLAPLDEIAPDLVHPVFGATMTKLFSHLPPGEWVRVCPQEQLLNPKNGYRL